MQSLNVELKPIDATWVQLRYWLGSAPPETRQLKLSDIQPLIDRGEMYYYTTRPNLVPVGQQLFAWLDGDGRWLSRAVQNCTPPGLVLAIDTDARLAHLPWEVLHDGQGFLVERMGTPVVPVRWHAGLPAAELAPQPRALQVLFMATSPEGVEPPLDFEGEEAEILRFTADLPLTLRVEESGCITEMGNLWRKHPGHSFDVFHLTGHATLEQGQPVFITETETGTLHKATAAELFRAFAGRLPRLVFLSGCRTAQAGNEGTVASMAETLVQQGLSAVLGWGQPVFDDSATTAAAQLYQRLAEGFSIPEALGETYRYLREKNVPDWHLLRLYLRGNAHTPLVDPPADYVPPLETVQDQFLDPEYRVRVATPAQFVGRRRLLQRCLRHLRQRDCIGLLLHGLGGNGKSTVAARLLERLPGYQPLVVYRQVDDVTLTSLLAQQCQSPTGHDILNGPLPPMQKLARFLKDGLNHPDQKFCVVLDDFEANLEADTTGKQVLRAEVVSVMNDLLNAIVQSGRPHRVIFTSRYDITFPQQNQRIARESVPALGGADLTKKYNRLPAFQPQAAVDPALQAQAKTVANGNPRLLEWLDLILQDPATNPAAILDRMAAEELKFREDILAEALLAQQTDALRQMLGRTLVYHLPVPWPAVEAVCAGLADLQHHRQRAVALGLLEQSLTGDAPHYRVPRVLQPLLPVAITPELEHTAATLLYRLWWEETETSTEEQWLEMHRLGVAAGATEIVTKMNAVLTNGWYNQSRYREVVALCQSTLEITEDGLALFNLAKAEQILGQPDAALKHYEQSLALYETIGDVKGKSATLHEMAYIYRQQGQVEQAMALYEQSLALDETIGDVQGKSATLHQMAYIYWQQGQVEQAMALYEQSLALYETIGDVQGKAATLHEMAYIYRQRGQVEQAMALYEQSLALNETIGDVQGKSATLAMMASLVGQQGDVEREVQLNLQAATGLAAIEAYGDLATVLNNLGVTDFSARNAYLAQSVWLSLRVDNPLDNIISRLSNLFNQVPEGDALEPLLATAAYFYCATRGKGHPQLEPLQEQSGKLLSAAASQRGITDMEGLQAWMAQEQLNDHDPEVFMPRLLTQLEALVGDHWVFDRSKLSPS